MATIAELCLAKSNTLTVIHSNLNEFEALRRTRIGKPTCVNKHKT